MILILRLRNGILSPREYNASTVSNKVQEAEAYARCAPYEMSPRGVFRRVNNDFASRRLPNRFVQATQHGSICCHQGVDLAPSKGDQEARRIPVTGQHSVAIDKGLDIEPVPSIEESRSDLCPKGAGMEFSSATA